MIKNFLIILTLSISIQYYILTQSIDPRVFKSGPKLCKHAKVFCEELLIHTEDSYILGVFHLFTYTKTSPVLFIHRPGGTGEDFLLNPDSFIYKLVLDGFDIWVLNLRGTIFSQRHLNVSESSKEFWEFSPVEAIRFDVQALADYVVKVTKAQKVSVVVVGEYGRVLNGLIGVNKKFLGKVDKVAWLAAGCEDFIGGRFWRFLVGWDWIVGVLEKFNVFSVFGRRSVFFGQIIQAFPWVLGVLGQNKYDWELDQEELKKIPYYETVATGHINLNTLKSLKSREYFPTFTPEKNKKIYNSPQVNITNFPHPTLKVSLFLSSQCPDPTSSFPNPTLVHTSTYPLSIYGFLLSKTQSFYPTLLSFLQS